MSSIETTQDEFPLPLEVDYEGTALTYEHPDRPARNTFLAWHRPRKQYVRQKQWTNAVLDVMSGRNVDERLKYVGLPGIDLLDIRQLLRTVCEPTSRKLQYIGFDLAAGSGSGDGTELNISQSELDARPSVYQPSGVRPDDLRYLSKRTTSAWHAVKSFGHVDVVNFDLTTTLFDGGPDEPDSYLGALKEVVALQAGNPNPWVLLVTTRVDRQDMRDSAIRPLLERFRGSIDSCPDLAEAIGLAGLTVPDEESAEAWGDDALRVSSLTATLQWIRGLLNNGSLSAKVRLTSCFVYTSFETAGVVDIASLVIRVDRKPTNLVDSVFSGPDLVQGDSGQDLGACSATTADFTRIAKAVDLDLLLEGDSGLRTEMQDLSADLLAEARYSKHDYRVWVNSSRS
ncbi:hypothetical protein [Plantibacter sp. VKM Ac-2876]|uniref:PP_RS20740 family protein n=1 Tax=Plantibacter sp. VKM Ac-2876 TaxID=2783826 RepID=UPI00188AC60F|nr:hypothetical protein [Plantibacter sp. VKM Ac-2876]MBF4566153.1 hypothetical protein [Plantibacter sp. VKM Ac-2876]